MVSYWLADPADLVTLTIVKLPEQDAAMRWQAAVLQHALRDISAWPVSSTIHAAWRCRAIKVDTTVDLHRNLITGLDRHWPPDPLREARILIRSEHTFGCLPERWMDILAVGQP
jgi:hypothetical protein